SVAPRAETGLDPDSADRRDAAADVVGPIDVALPDRHAVGKRTAFGELYRVGDLAGDHVAFEERAHVGVGFPEILRVSRLDPDAVRPVADGRKHVLDGPAPGIDSIDHARRRHRDPQLAELRLDAVGTGAWRGWTRISGDRAA